MQILYAMEVKIGGFCVPPIHKRVAPRMSFWRMTLQA